jgi:hypothetical protein
LGAEEIASEGRITLRWRTASEQDNLGFNVYRSDTTEGPWTKLNSDLIPGQGTTSKVHQYEFVDQPVERFRSYYYYLESISTAGIAERYSGTIHGMDDRTVTGSERRVGSVELPVAVRAGAQTLQPGSYELWVQEVVKEAELVNDLGAAEAGRARYIREGTTHLLIRRAAEVLADELMIPVAAADPDGPPIELIMLRPDTAPPAGEPRQLLRLTVRDHGRVLRAFFEPAS